MSETKQVCAWCGLVLCEGTEPVSHGICPPCAFKLTGFCDHSWDWDTIEQRITLQGDDSSLTEKRLCLTCGIKFDLTRELDSTEYRQAVIDAQEEARLDAADAQLEAMRDGE